MYYFFLFVCVLNKTKPLLPIWLIYKLLYVKCYEELCGLQLLPAICSIVQVLNMWLLCHFECLALRLADAVVYLLLIFVFCYVFSCIHCVSKMC